MLFCKDFIIKTSEDSHSHEWGPIVEIWDKDFFVCSYYLDTLKTHAPNCGVSLMHNKEVPDYHLTLKDKIRLIKIVESNMRNNVDKTQQGE